VITGASQGLGKSFTKEIARQIKNLILNSLPEENLSGLCLNLEKEFGIKAIYYETDLSINSNVLKLAKWLNEHFEINFLINNAGVGGTKKFDEVSSNYIEKIIQINVMATSMLTHQLLPNLKRQHQSYIMNVSSLAAFSSIGYKTEFDYYLG